MIKTSKELTSVCIVLPAFNEASAIDSVLEDIWSTFDGELYELSIVVVDDCSNDATGKKASKHGAHVIHHIINYGAGGATSTGLTFAKEKQFDIAATMDADGQHRAIDVLEGVKMIGQSNFDLLIGSRLIDSKGMSQLKLVGNKGLSLITFILFGSKQTDSQSGLRIFSKRAIQQLRWDSSGYEFCSEMLWRARRLGLTVGEYPIKAIYTDYSKSKGQNNWNGINIVKSMLAQRIKGFLE